MKRLYLSGKRGKGKYALVDDEDYSKVSAYKWYLHSAGYAVSNKQGLLLHRHILGAGPGVEVDHRNMDRLDCRQENLRLATRQQNSFNKKPYSNNTSGIKGVSWYAARGKWHAQARVGAKRYHLGYFTDKNIAAETYNAFAKKRMGEFARLNEVV